jgi:hypothetical protein
LCAARDAFLDVTPLEYLRATCETDEEATALHNIEESRADFHRRIATGGEVPT